jgi:hypothetical protein
MRASAGAACALALAGLVSCMTPAHGGELVLAGEDAPVVSEIAQRFAIVGDSPWAAAAGSRIFSSCVRTASSRPPRAARC